ncbi:ADP compounds hydrolase NudE [Celerinatantimonas yamalensis]|uniref:ADP compounds hydrolase NudE n=1 Tax=Celerinatantimonas yamalensis TaxID=559956 RepID=A0ABW9G759_9GAMM
MPKQRPKVLEQHITAQSHFFKVEALHLEFSNGERRVYERLTGGQAGAVMVVPVTADGQLLLVREYAAATERYELSFPKGAIDAGETAQQAANRELQEEIGFAAEKWQLLKEVTVAPSFFGGVMQIFVADELYPSRLLGDEPEPLIVESIPIEQALSLIDRPEFSEARTIAALYLFHQWWQNRG